MSRNMSLDEMSGLRCPLATKHPNKTKEGIFTHNCIGDDCALWRWGEQRESGFSDVDFPKEGYCGMGGSHE